MLSVFIASGVILLFIAVVILRALLFRPFLEETVVSSEELINEHQAVHALQELVRCKTISNRDASVEDEEAFNQLDSLLPVLYPHVAHTCRLHRPNDRSLLFHWKGRSADKPGVLMAHYDVVPANEDLWEQPAFEGVIKDGFLWGRGTLDTKATMAGILQAADNLIADDFTPEHDLYLAFSGNEEICGNGAPSIVDWFSRQGVKPAFVLDEGGAVVDNVFPGVNRPCALVGIGEKGPLDLKLTLESNGGHSSTPPAHTSVGVLAKAVSNIERHPFPFTLTPPIRQMFDVLGRHSTFLYRVIFANLWCFSPVLNLFCRHAGGELNALVRTTVAFTQMQGSPASNVLPPHAWVGANLRLMTGETVTGAQKHLQRLCGDERIHVEVVTGMEPSPISRTDDEPYRRLSLVIRATWPDAIVSPYLMLACSDSRHYVQICDHVYRFSAMALTKEERDMIHGNNERIPLETIRKTVAFFQRLIKAC